MIRPLVSVYSVLDLLKGMCNFDLTFTLLIYSEFFTTGLLRKIADYKTYEIGRNTSAQRTDQ